MERSGCMENTNDVHKNSNLADRFDGKVKDLWLDLCDLISLYFPNLSELDRLKILSYITQFVYQQCSRKAEKAIQSFTFGHVEMVTKKELNILLAIRKRAGKAERTRDAIVQEIYDKTMKTENVKKIVKPQHSKLTSTLTNFIKELADVCWLMSISQPVLFLNFEFKASMTEKFVEYSAEVAPDVDGNLKTGDVLLVVRPSVEYKDGSGYLKKGLVVVVPKCVEIIV
ncbi:hypothetical protein DPMN_097933 [Dreissena polymorpha]|uniref:Mitochondria-eating protein C-terminal domain-containing protein n=1 Tax=Dreissena polymorpha TaxID=45954 RepID=A0A9D4LC22_DREPO|nr:hypothetical protein DPMN_097933 [Dreissena polymorpha]